MHISQPLLNIKQQKKDEVVVYYGNRKTTGENLCRRVATLAVVLSELKVRKGSRIAIASQNSDYFLECVFAITSIGATAVLLNYKWSAKEAVTALNKTGASLAILDIHCLPWWDSLCSESKSLAGGLFLGDPSPSPSSSGSPKAVLLPHRALSVQSLAKMAILSLNPKDVYLHVLPLCHVGGLSSALAIFQSCACHVIMERYHLEGVVRALSLPQMSPPPTVLSCVPPMLHDLLSLRLRGESPSPSPSPSPPLFPHLSTLLIGGGSLPPKTAQLLPKLLPHTKVFLAYGMTETASSITFLHLSPSPSPCPPPPPPPLPPTAVCVGFPAPHVAVEVRAPSSPHAPLGQGQVGEIFTRGPHLFLGYCPPQGEGQGERGGDGWLGTGDLGLVDGGGFLWLSGRKSEAIRCGALTVMPAELEGCLDKHPLVAKASVVPLPHSRLGEVPAALLQLRGEGRGPTLPPSLPEIQAFCLDQGLSRFKLPRYIVCQLEELPLTSIGKVQKQRVKEIILKHFASTTGLSKL